ncbi:MAG: tetratricopeptide repeat protein [Bacteroidota bacterium]|nr:tetratricopeptide repeat protein [Bacteroidota bacterium]
MKVLFFLPFFLFSPKQILSQNYKPDSLILALKNAKHDTTRCATLARLVEVSDDWEKYNQDLKELTEKNIPLYKNNKAVQNVFKKYFSSYLNNTGMVFNNKGEPDKAMDYFNRAYAINKEVNNIDGMANNLGNIAYIYHNKGNIEKALELDLESLVLREKINDKLGAASSLNNIAGIFNNKGDVLKAIEYYEKSMAYREEIDDKRGVAMVLTNLGNIYKKQGDIDKALEYYEKSLAINKPFGSKIAISTCLNNIGIIYSQKKNNKKALEYHFQSLVMRESDGDKRGISGSLSNIGIVYSEQGKTDSALVLFEKALSISQALEDKKAMAGILCHSAKVYFKINKIKEALQYANRSLEISLHLGNPENIQEASGLLYTIYKKQGNSTSALQMHELFIQMRDSIGNKETRKASIRSQFKYEYEKKEAEVKAVAKAEKEKAELVAREEKNKQQLIIVSVCIGLLLAVIFGVFMFNRFKVTQNQKKLIEIKEKETLHQKHLIEEKNKEITDSINYAQRIQRSLLASDNFLSQQLSDFFILFKPKDIVSGDFYWADKLSNDTFALVTADSTGHGVPGAIMSMLNIACLNEAVSKGFTQAHDILFETRNRIIEHLRNDGSKDGGKDGMDCSLLCIDFKNKMLYTAAANNPVWIIRNSELLEIKPDKMPVGKHDKDREPFTLHTFQLQSSDTIYTLTDGYPDQFGGDKGKKFMTKKLKDVLIANVHLPMAKQKEMLETIFTNWVGDLEQVDDVTIIGIRI